MGADLHISIPPYFILNKKEGDILTAREMKERWGEVDAWEDECKKIINEKVEFNISAIRQLLINKYNDGGDRWIIYRPDVSNRKQFIDDGIINRTITFFVEIGYKVILTNGQLTITW